MPLIIVRNDITHMQVDAIVNAANPSLLGGGGVDGAIHRAAGPGLLAECRTLGGCRVGEAKLTGGYNLPSRYVIHTVGAGLAGRQQGRGAGPGRLLPQRAAAGHARGFETVAFPLISAGGVRLPPGAEAFQVATGTIQAFLQQQELHVYLVLFDRDSFVIGAQRYRDIAAYIDDCYSGAHSDPTGPAAAAGRTAEVCPGGERAAVRPQRGFLSGRSGRAPRSRISGPARGAAPAG